MDITELLTFTKQQGASDLHLSAGLPPMIRLHGSLRRLKMDPLNKEALRKMLTGILSEEQRKRFESDLELDFSHNVNGQARCRDVFRQERGDGAAFRLIPSDCPTLKQLNMPAVLTEMALKEKGLVPVTGPMGSGKSTTLAVNLSGTSSQGLVRLPLDGLREKSILLEELFSEARYSRDGNDMAETGLFVDLPAWGYHFFKFDVAASAAFAR